MSIDNETAQETASTSRRALLKGAAAVGVGAAVYSSPIVSSVPAYATHGLSSFVSSSGTQCMWFSPNQVDTGGKWHGRGPTNNAIDSGNTGAGTFIPGLATMTVSYTVGGISRSLKVTGNPNNEPGSSGNNTGAQASEFYGGGVALQLFDPLCELVIVGVVCNSGNSGIQSGNPLVADCSNTSTNTAPVSWAVGSSLSVINQAGAPNGNVGGGRFQGDATRKVYYHTGRTGNGQGNRCKFSLLFNIRCA